MVKITKTIHRKYPDRNWEYKGISTIVKDCGIERELIYCEANGIKSVEMYTGSNYIVGSKNRSYSRKYSMNEIPKKYKDIVKILVAVFNSMEWSTEKYVNIN